jgi:phospholipase/carboxylesterase
VSGFSDGASYALSLGLANGELFGDVLAFSPGFMAPAALAGKPRIFMSHGVDDRVLPIDRCSRRIAPQLRAHGYDVDYREFPGPHVVPPEMGTAALERFLGPAPLNWRRTRKSTRRCLPAAR